MIIGLGYKAGVGKSTIAQIISETFGFKRFSFSELIRSEINEAVAKQGFVFRFIYPDTLIINNETIKLDPFAASDVYRILTQIIAKYPNKVALTGGFLYTVFDVDDKILLQFWGFNYRRKKDENYWIKKFKEIYNPGENYIIENIRFPNEAIMIKELSGIVAKVVLVDNEGKELQLLNDARLTDHQTETALDNYEFDITLFNYYGNLEKTKEEVIAKIAPYVKRTEKDIKQESQINETVQKNENRGNILDKMDNKENSIKEERTEEETTAFISRRGRRQ